MPEKGNLDGLEISQGLVERATYLVEEGRKEDELSCRGCYDEKEEDGVVFASVDIPQVVARRERLLNS